MNEINTELIFDIRASVRVDAAPEDVYAVASDITRMGQWSPENTGGEWTSGDPGTVGAQFHGHNEIEGQSFTTECEVVDASPGHRFAWSVLSYSPTPDNSVWSFEVEPDGDATVLTQRYVLRDFTEKIREFLDELPADKVTPFLDGRRAQLQDAMHRTVGAIKEASEAS